jgi:hypothetical protein
LSFPVQPPEMTQQSNGCPNGHPDPAGSSATFLNVLAPS